MTTNGTVAAVREVLKALFIKGSQPDTSSMPAEVRGMAEITWALLTDTEDARLDVPDSAIEVLPEEFRHIAKLRWNALLYWHRGEFRRASQHLVRAIEESSPAAPEGWRRANLEEDQLHCLIARANSGDQEARDMVLRNAKRERARASIDPRYTMGLASAFRMTLESQIEELQRSPHTVVFGGNLESTLERFGESFHLALAQASISLVSSARRDLGHILYHYGRFYEAPDLVIGALVLYLLERNSKRVEGILKTDWQLLYSSLSCSPLRFMDQLSTRDNPLDVSVHCSVYKTLGAYVPDYRVADLQAFVLGAFDLDSEKGFRAVSMRKVLEVLPTFVNLLDSQLILERVRPLLSGHPVVVSDVLRVLVRLDWGRVEEPLATAIASELFEIRDRMVSGPGPFAVLIKIRQKWPEATKELEDKLLAEWNAEKLEAGIIYFADIPESLSHEARVSFASHLLDLLEDENVQEKDAPLRFGGYSKWYLVSGFLVLETPQLLDRALKLAAEVVLNPHQGGHVKRECIDVILWLHDKCPSDRTKILSDFVNPVLGAAESTMSCRSDDFLLRYSKERLQLRLDELASLEEQPDYGKIVRDCAKLGVHPFVDTRADTIRVLTRLVETDSAAEHQEIPCLLLSRTYDDWDRNSGDAITALSRWVGKDSTWEPFFLSRLDEMYDHASPYVRSCLLHAAAHLARVASRRERFAALIRRGRSDLHHDIRCQARTLAEKLSSET